MLPKPKDEPRYQTGAMDFIDGLYNLLPREQFKGFCIGNILKYVLRYPAKGGEVDLEKAKTYLGWLDYAEKDGKHERDKRD